MPLDAARRVHKVVLENTITGRVRAKSLAEEIMSIGNVSRNKANLIARTETSRVSTGITQARSSALGIPWYQWETSEDVRVRHSHYIMDKVLVKWSEPPSPEQLARQKSYGHYHAGCTFNCRCYAAPIVDIDDIKFPCKIYHRGMLGTISRSKFEEINGLSKQAA